MILPDWLKRGVDANFPGSSASAPTIQAQSASASDDAIRTSSTTLVQPNENGTGPSPTSAPSAAMASSAPTFRAQSAFASDDAIRTSPSTAPVQPNQNDEMLNLHQGLENNEVNVEDQDPRGPRVEGKFLVRIDAGGYMQPSNKASQLVLDGVMMHAHPSGYCWKTVPPDVVQLYWEEFQKRCTWDTNRYNTNQMYAAFLKKIRKRYSDFFSELRLKNIQPKWVRDDTWKTWTSAWASPEYNRKRLQAKLNRRKGDLSQPAEATHTGGSISHSETLDRMTILLGCVPTAHELFAFTHTKRHDGTSWSDPRAQSVGEEYIRMVVASIQREESRATDLLKTYYEVAGGHNKKRRLYGLGDAACRYYGSQCSSAPNTPAGSTSTSSSDPHSHLQSQLDKLHQTVQTFAENVVKTKDDIEVQIRDQLGPLQNVLVRFELELAEIRESRAQNTSQV